MKNAKDDKRFLVTENSQVDLNQYKTYIDLQMSEKDLENEMQDNIQKIGNMQEMLYAQGKQSVLIVFQAMDAAGKDSTIAHVTTGINPAGVIVSSFKQPSKEELAHDFLWRCYKNMPPRGYIGIFNRSHYEEVLVCKVHPQYILGQNIPGIQSLEDIDKNFWENRYQSIRNMENHLAQNGTKIIKFFLNVSKEEQKQRFLSRIAEPEKNWKFSYGDVQERQHWDNYMQAYTQLLSKTSTVNAPWYIIPADDKPSMRYIVSEIIKENLKELNLEYPIVSDKQLQEMEQGKKDLSAK